MKIDFVITLQNIIIIIMKIQWNHVTHEIILLIEVADAMQSIDSAMIEDIHMQNKEKKLNCVEDIGFKRIYIFVIIGSVNNMLIVFIIIEDRKKSNK